MNPLPYRLTPLAIALSLLPVTAAGADWDCRQGSSGEWLCGATDAAQQVPLVIDQPVTPGAQAIPAPSAKLPPTPAPPAGLADAPAPTSPRTAGKPVAASPAPANPAWALCPPLPERNIHFDTRAGRSDAETRLDADSAEALGDGTYELHGAAVAHRADQHVTADHLRYNDVTGRVDAEGNVELNEPGLRLKADSAYVVMDDETGEIRAADYLLYTNHARGEASTIYLEGPQRKRLANATYTTCAYGSNTWGIRAKSVTLKQDEGMGVARNARLEVKDIPVLYTPYISFPIDDRRKSGLLTPSLGSSDEGGLDVRLPYYWNIAPHRDATITPHHMGDRGLMLGTEFRYLNRNSLGQLEANVLPSDDSYGEDRHFARFEHTGTLGDRVQLQADLNDVSDEDYFEDFGQTLSTTSITHLQRRVDATYRGDGWSLKGRLQNFQTVDPDIAASRRPYERLPQVTFTGTPSARPLGLVFNIKADATAFGHSQDDLVDTGNRVDLRPRVSLPIRRTAYEVTPALTLAHTQYDIDRINPALDESPSRTLPMFSLDNKVFFERNTRAFGSEYLQTLEPRAFYLYVPEENQDTLPVFDSGNRTFRFRELFSENRFTGNDRVGDANQLALALTSRYLDPLTGDEKLRASIGEIFYFEDREVTLRGTAPDTVNQSAIAGELAVHFTRRWSVSADALWDPDQASTQKSNAGISYRGDARRVANLSYRYTKNRLEQVEASWLWPLAPAWHMVGLIEYSLEDNHTLEGLAALEYETCCSAFRIAWRSVLNNANTGDNNEAVYLEWELKGLTSLGDKVESLLESGILGYQR